MLHTPGRCISSVFSPPIPKLTTQRAQPSFLCSLEFASYGWMWLGELFMLINAIDPGSCDTRYARETS